MSRLLGLFRKRFQFEQVDTLEWSEIQDRVLVLVARYFEAEMKDVEREPTEEDAKALAKTVTDELAKSIVAIKAARDMEDIAGFLVQFD